MRIILFVLFSFILFQSFSKDTLIVGYNNSAPFIFEDNHKIQGPIFWLWENIAEENDFHCEYKKLESDRIIEGLTSGKVDVMLYPMTITSERAESIDFSAPFYLAHSGVVANEYSAWEKSKIFLSSFFSLNFFRVLGGLCLIILIFGFFTWIFERKTNKEEFGGGIRGLWSGFWWSAVTMTTVGYGDKSPRTTGGRLVALIWMFTAVIIISGFTASIASTLTVTELETEMSTIENFKDKRLGTVDNSGTMKWLNDKFYNNQKLYSTKEELIPALRSGEVDAVVYDLPLLYEMIKIDTIQEFKILPIRFNPQYYALGMNAEVKDSVQKTINTSLLKNTESHEWGVVLAEFGLDIK
jgi:ABC-type amino acid transport substrate-binding protein